MKVTSEDVTINYRDYGEITVPKGTLITNQTALGEDPNYNFVADFSWIKPHDDGTPQFGLLHDAKYYGMNIPADKVREI